MSLDASKPAWMDAVALTKFATALLQHSQSLAAMNEAFDVVLGDKRDPTIRAAYRADAETCKELSAAISALVESQVIPPEMLTRLSQFPAAMKRLAEQQAQTLGYLRSSFLEALKPHRFQKSNESATAEASLVEACRTIEALLEALPAV